MDRDDFDAFARLLASSGSRRAALGALLSASLFGTSLGAVAKKRAKARGGKRRDKGRGKDKDRDKGENKDKAKKRKQQRKNRAGAEAAAGCCKSGNCSPGTGKNLTRCCFEGQTLTKKSFKSSNLTEANFTGAILTNANFASTNLTGACLVDATITGANFKSANLSGVIRCRTITESGEDNSGCHLGTPCCPTCANDDHCGDGQVCCDGRCVVGECCPCQQSVNGQCQPVPDFTVACNGSPLLQNGVLMCTTQPNTGVCVDGTCGCGSGVYDASANVCRCSGGDAFCRSQGCEGCQISRVCLSTVDSGQITNPTCFGC